MSLHQCGSEDRNANAPLQSFQATRPYGGDTQESYKAPTRRLHVFKQGCRLGGTDTPTGMLPSTRLEAQLAFKDSMIHGILQFALHIAFRCVLHRCGSQDIRC